MHNFPTAAQRSGGTSLDTPFIPGDNPSHPHTRSLGRTREIEYLRSTCICCSTEHPTSRPQRSEVEGPRWTHRSSQVTTLRNPSPDPSDALGKSSVRVRLAFAAQLRAQHPDRSAAKWRDLRWLGGCAGQQPRSTYDHGTRCTSTSQAFIRSRVFARPIARKTC